MGNNVPCYSSGSVFVHLVLEKIPIRDIYIYIHIHTTCMSCRWDEPSLFNVVWVSIGFVHSGVSCGGHWKNDAGDGETMLGNLRPPISGVPWCPLGDSTPPLLPPQRPQAGSSAKWPTASEAKCQCSSSWREAKSVPSTTDARATDELSSQWDCAGFSGTPKTGCAGLEMVGRWSG